MSVCSSKNKSHRLQKQRKRGENRNKLEDAATNKKQIQTSGTEQSHILPGKKLTLIEIRCF